MRRSIEPVGFLSQCLIPISRLRLLEPPLSMSYRAYGNPILYRAVGLNNTARAVIRLVEQNLAIDRTQAKREACLLINQDLRCSLRS
jgi:hypothetical protein